MNYKKILFALFVLSGLAGLVWLIWYFTTHSKNLRIISVDKAGRKITTVSPLGRVSFSVTQGANIFDTTAKKTGKYELLYRSNDLGATVDVVFTRAVGLPPIEAATVNMETGQVTPRPPVLMVNQK